MMFSYRNFYMLLDKVSIHPYKNNIRAQFLYILYSNYITGNAILDLNINYIPQCCIIKVTV